MSSVLSGNRNFEGRVHAHVKANYLASPPLVVAYALAGTVDIDFEKIQSAKIKMAIDVFLKDIWPTSEEIQEAVKATVTPELFREEYAHVFTENERGMPSKQQKNHLRFDENSTYIQNPPFFEELVNRA